MGKPVTPRAQARTDVENIVGHYLREAGADVALRFVAALEVAYGAIAARPGAGSPRFAHELGLPGLRRACHQCTRRSPLSRRSAPGVRSARVDSGTAGTTPKFEPEN